MHLYFLQRQGQRFYSTCRTLASDIYTNPGRANEPAATTTPSGLSHKSRDILDSALRVDQAGEIAADWIYRGQLFVYGRHPTLGPMIQDMWDQEKKHLDVMNKLQIQHDIRPTILTEVAKVAGFTLGAATALMGKEAAMACTEAVETVIGEHYDDQLKEFEALPNDHPSIPVLRSVIEEFRDDELEHLETAVENDAQRAPAHALLSSVIGSGCKLAIEICKKV